MDTVLTKQIEDLQAVDMFPADSKVDVMWDDFNAMLIVS